MNSITAFFNTYPFLAPAIGALIGAFTAFILVVLRESVNSISDKRKRHLDTLVKLERQIWFHQGILDDNILVLTRFAETLRQGHLYWTEPHAFDFDPDILLDLQNVELLNDYFSLFHDLRRFNDGVANIRTAYKLLEAPQLTGALPEGTYKVNALSLAEGLDSLIITLEQEIQPQLLENVSKIRYLLKADRTIGMNIRGLFTKSHTVKEAEWKKEEIKVKKEMDDSREESRIQKEKLYGKLDD